MNPKLEKMSIFFVLLINFLVEKLQLLLAGYAPVGLVVKSEVLLSRVIIIRVGNLISSCPS